MIGERLRILYYYMLGTPTMKWHRKDYYAAETEFLMLERLGRITIELLIYPEEKHAYI